MQRINRCFRLFYLDVDFSMATHLLNRPQPLDEEVQRYEDEDATSNDAYRLRRHAALTQEAPGLDRLVVALETPWGNGGGCEGVVRASFGLSVGTWTTAYELTLSSTRRPDRGRERRWTSR